MYIYKLFLVYSFKNKHICLCKSNYEASQHQAYYFDLPNLKLDKNL